MQRGAKKIREEAKADRADLNSKREAAVEKLAATEAKRGEVKANAINASSEQAAVQAVAERTGLSEKAVASVLILVFAAGMPLFSVTLMVAGGHAPKAHMVAAPVSVEAKPEPVAKPAATPAKKPVDRSAAAKKGWETRRRKAAMKAGKVLAMAS